VRSIFSVLAAGLVLAAGAGCGDDETSGEGTTTPAAAATTTADTTTAPTEDDYVRPEPPSDQSTWAAEVDAACEPIQSEIDALPPPTDPVSLESWVAQVLPLVREEVAAVEAVAPPAAGQEEAADITLFVASLGRLEDALTRYLAALRADDAAATEQALAEANAAGAQARTTAEALGVTECGGYSGS
jgi:hypothetical protein